MRKRLENDIAMCLLEYSTLMKKLFFLGPCEIFSKASDYQHFELFMVMSGLGGEED